MHILKEILRSLKFKSQTEFGWCTSTHHLVVEPCWTARRCDCALRWRWHLRSILHCSSTCKKDVPTQSQTSAARFNLSHSIYYNHACTTHFWAMRCPHFVFWCTSLASMSQWVILGLVRRHALNRTPIMKASISVYACCRSCKVCAILRSLNDSSFVLWKTILYRPQWLLKLTVETWLIGPCWMRLGMQYSLTDTPCAHSFDLILNVGISG